MGFSTAENFERAAARTGLIEGGSVWLVLRTVDG